MALDETVASRSILIDKTEFIPLACKLCGSFKRCMLFPCDQAAVTISSQVQRGLRFTAVHSFLRGILACFSRMAMRVRTVVPRRWLVSES
jgi:hypothetical protein